jgi:hypothetical protein
LAGVKQQRVLILDEKLRKGDVGLRDERGNTVDPFGNFMDF